jgi:hypothetical protein
MRGRVSRLRPSHDPARDGNGAAKPATDSHDLGPVELSQPLPEQVEDRSLDDERRMRAAGGPEDRAHYSCACGYQFEANVSTAVSCPHCGTGQAW